MRRRHSHQRLSGRRGAAGRDIERDHPFRIVDTALATNHGAVTGGKRDLVFILGHRRLLGPALGNAIRIARKQRSPESCFIDVRPIPIAEDPSRCLLEIARSLLKMRTASGSSDRGWAADRSSSRPDARPAPAPTARHTPHSPRTIRAHPAARARAADAAASAAVACRCR